MNSCFHVCPQTHRFVPHMTVAQTRGEREAKALIRTLAASESGSEAKAEATAGALTLCILQRERMGAPMKVVKKIAFGKSSY